MTRCLRIFVLFVVASLACARGAAAADPVQVFVDARDPAFVVLQGVAADIAPSALSEMTGYAALERVSLVGWEAFRQNPEAYIQPYVVKYDYPARATLLGVVALVKSYPGKPFAVTWNGGLAVEFFDFQYAVRTHRAYLDDAQAYERARPTDLARDPLDPARHIADLLER